MTPSSDREDELIDSAWKQFEQAVSSTGGSRTRSGAGAPGGTLKAGPPLTRDAFPGYRILRELHRGGQGVVHLAIRESTGKKVAIKVLRDGPMATAVELTRFDQEAELLTRLQHPNIVSIQDRGESQGYRYFVMDYVPGGALDVRGAPLGGEARGTLALFRKICDAVNVAHLRGVVHRDLKPSNIRLDENGEPKILDFGLARLTGSDPQEATRAMTQTGQFVGSLPWASPEQAQGAVDRIDVRSDVYSLGVILYQMLTGQFPYDVTGSLHDVSARIATQAPARPSAVKPGIGDEIETIVLKCLAKEPERRYQSAGDVGRDIGRYLEGEPIEAKRDSSWYVLRKLAQRHRAPVAFSALVVTLVMISAVAMWVLYREAERSRGQAEAREREARVESLKASRIQEFLKTVFYSASPASTSGQDGGVLDRMMAEARVRARYELADEPEVLASVRDTLGQIYGQLGKFEEARDQLQAALDTRVKLFGREHPDVASSLQQMAMLNIETERLAEAEPMAKESLEIRVRLFGDDSNQAADSIETMGQVAWRKHDIAEAERCFRQALAIRLARLGEGNVRLIPTYRNLANAIRETNRFEEAIELYEKAYKLSVARLGRENPETGKILGALGALRSERLEIEPAEEALVESLRISRLVYKGPHPQTATVLNSLGALYNRASRHEEAIPLIRESLEMRRQLMGGEDTERCAPLHLNLGVSYKHLSKWKEAEAEYRACLELARSGHDERLEATCLNNLAALRKTLGDLTASEAYDREALAIRRKLFGEKHLDVAQSLNNLATTLRSTGHLAEAAELHRQSLAIHRELMGDRALLTGMSLCNLGGCLVAIDPAQADAEPTLREAVATLELNGPPARKWLVSAKFNLATTLVAKRSFFDAEPLMMACEREARNGAEVGLEWASVVRAIVRMYVAWGKADEAAAWRAKLKQ